VITADGVEREIDTLICATGFEVFQKGSVPTYSVIGKNGLDISDYWEQNRYQAFMGTTVPEFPNFFMIFGPYSVCTASWFGMVENQTRHLSRCLKAARERGANYIEVKKRSHDRDYKRVQRNGRLTIFTVGNCTTSNSYYFDRHGDSPTIRPTMGVLHWLRTRLFRPPRHYTIASK
jgi:cation diffusion facilitator CzcD-associated flavoprotein CzcO